MIKSPVCKSYFQTLGFLLPKHKELLLCVTNPQKFYDNVLYTEKAPCLKVNNHFLELPMVLKIKRFDLLIKTNAPISGAFLAYHMLLALSYEII